MEGSKFEGDILLWMAEENGVCSIYTAGITGLFLDSRIPDRKLRYSTQLTDKFAGGLKL